MEYVRSVYRVEVNGSHCIVKARFRGRVITGMALDVSTAGLGATFQADESSGHLLPDVGESGKLTITAEWCRDSVVVDGRVIRRADTDGDLCILGFEFTARPTDIYPELNNLFNRRRTVRVGPAPDRPVEVTMTAGSSFEVKGTLLDISSTGVAFEATVPSQLSLGYTRSARIMIGLGADAVALRIPAIIRNRRSGGQSNETGQSKVIYGVGFVVPGSRPKLQMRIDAYVKQLQAQVPSRVAT